MPRKSNNNYTHRTTKSLEFNHNRPIVVPRSGLLSKFSPIFGRTGPKGASRLITETLHPPAKAGKTAPEPSPTVSCFTKELDPFRRSSLVLPIPPDDEQPAMHISLPASQASEPMKLRELVPKMQDTIQGATRISPLNPIRAFHLPTRWVPRTAQMDANAFSHPSQENPLKIVLGSGLLATPRSRSTTGLSVAPETHHHAHGITTPPRSPDRVSLEYLENTMGFHPLDSPFKTGDRLVAYANYSEFSHRTTIEDSYDGMSEDETRKYTLCSHQP